MARVLYELLGDEDRRFSPYCWRIRLALAHKGLEAEFEPCRFTEMDKVAFSGGKTVPVLVDGESVVRDSWAIACHLEDAYADRPSLFGGARGRALARFVNLWTDGVFHPALFPLVVADVHDAAHPDDRAYFRQSREARLGRALVDPGAAPETHAANLSRALAPLRALIGEQPFVAGADPAYADYTVFGAFQWARCTSPHPLLAPDDPLVPWRTRLLDLYDGLARTVPAFA